jgi:nicotinic acid mononucleotide adenylyltransferase
VEVSDVESRLSTPSLTLRTLEHLAREHADWSLRLVIGSDVLFEARKWHAFDQICQLAPPLVLARVGFPHPDAPVAVLPEVSSTRIRQLAAAGDRRQLGYLLPRSVLDFVEQHGLYR